MIFFALVFFIFVVVTGEVDSRNLRLTLIVNKIREFIEKCTSDKRKLLVDKLRTDVEDLFLD